MIIAYHYLKNNVLNHSQPVQALVGAGDVVGGAVIHCHFCSIIVNLIHGVFIVYGCGRRSRPSSKCHSANVFKFGRR